MLVRFVSDGAFRLGLASGKLSSIGVKKHHDADGNVIWTAPVRGYKYHDGDAYDPNEYILIE